VEIQNLLKDSEDKTCLVQS